MDLGWFLFAFFSIGKTVCDILWSGHMCVDLDLDVESVQSALVSSVYLDFFSVGRRKKRRKNDRKLCNYPSCLCLVRLCITGRAHTIRMMPANRPYPYS